MKDPAGVGITAVDPAGLVHRLTAPNPGPMTLQGTNTYLVGREPFYVIDPGPEDMAHLRSITEWVEATARTAGGILLTHGHPDHAPGAALLASMLNVPVWGAGTPPYPLYSAPAHRDFPPNAAFPVDDIELTVIPTPGHTPDSVSFYLPGAGVLFTGDTVLGQGSSLVAPPEGDMGQYVASLHHLLSIPARILAPGHGPLVPQARRKIEEYLEHRRARESQLIDALSAGPSTVGALTSRYYVDTPPALRSWAEGSVTAGLHKLERAGIVRHDGTTWSLMPVDGQ